MFGLCLATTGLEHLWENAELKLRSAKAITGDVCLGRFNSSTRDRLRLVICLMYTIK